MFKWPRSSGPVMLPKLYHTQEFRMHDQDMMNKGNMQVRLTMFGTLVTGVLLMSAGKGDKLFAMPGLLGNWGFTPVDPICCPPVWLKGCPKGLVLPVIPIWKRMNEIIIISLIPRVHWENICQILISAFTETEFQCQLLNIIVSILQL